MQICTKICIFAGLALALTGCASLKALETADGQHRALTIGYIGLANWVIADEASAGVTPARIAADDLRRLEAWRALLVERAIYDAAGLHPVTSLDALADSLRPPGA